MSDREELLQIKNPQKEQIQVPAMNVDTAVEEIAELAKKTCNALVKRGFTMDAAVYLTGRILPSLI